MNLSFFIARLIAANRKASFSRFIIRLATVATALSVAIMIISVAVVFGFKENIKDKIFVFWGHIQIAPFNPNPGASIIVPEPFHYSNTLLQQIRSESAVTAVHPFAVKAAILNTGNVMQGIKLKGVDNHYDWKSNAAITFTGKIPDFNDTAYAHQIVVSQTILDKLDQKIGYTLQVF
ncbi:MAG: ABC transporter permease, partial [Sphingobacteriales bacterium]